MPDTVTGSFRSAVREGREFPSVLTWMVEMVTESFKAEFWSDCTLT